MQANIIKTRLKTIALYGLWVLVFQYLHFTVFADVVIKGKIDGKVAMTYYKPFKGFANNMIESVYDFKGSQHFELRFQIEQPTFIRLRFSGRQLLLLCERSDTYELLINTEDPGPEWLTAEGKNLAGHLYFNRTYNSMLMTKFNPIKDIIDQFHDEEASVLSLRLLREIERQTNWVDSLESLDQVTAKYAEYMKVQIRSLLGWGIGDLSNKYFGSKPDSKSTQIMQSIFEAIDPLDLRLRNCLALTGYYYTYFESKYGSVLSSDSAQVVAPEAAYFAFAPAEIQDLMWGYVIYLGRLITPTQYDYCQLYKKYKRNYTDGLWIEYLEGSGICTKREGTYELIRSSDTDLLSFVRNSLAGKRFFIDLWATWCAPCKIEFKTYDEAFYKYMEERRIELLFISVDKQDHKDRWEREVKALGLRGFHYLAGKKLQASIRDIVFDQGNMIIPRYLLIDETGKILSINVTRPSDLSFKTEIERLLPN